MNDSGELVAKHQNFKRKISELRLEINVCTMYAIREIEPGIFLEIPLTQLMKNLDQEVKRIQG